MRLGILILTFCTLFSLSLLSQSKADRYVYSQIAISVDQIPNLYHLADQGLEIDHFHRLNEEQITFVIDDEQLMLLESSEIPFELLLADLETHHDERLSSSPRSTQSDCGLTNYSEGSMGTYHTHDEIIAQIDLMKELFPDLISSKDTIGVSYEGRPIFVLKISDNPDLQEEGESVVYYDALTHAREPMSIEAMLYYMWWLLENYGIDEEATYLVDHRAIYFVPIVNPDGYVYNEGKNPNGGGMWRKNRKEVENGCHGVDLNRNYSEGWGLDIGSTSDPCGQTYRGEEAFSEPESQAVRDLVLEIEPSIGFSIHTYGHKFMNPLSPVDSVVNYEVYADMASEFIPDSYLGYGTVKEMLNYYSSGTTRDFLHANGTFAWTPEIGKGGTFWPDPDLICEYVTEFQKPMKYLSWVAGAYPRFHDYYLSNDFFVYVGDTSSLYIRLKNKGLGADATDVKVVLESANEQVQIIQSELYYNDIGPRAFQTNDDIPFQIWLEEDLMNTESISIDISVYQGEQLTDQRSINLQIAGPAPQVLFSDDAESGMANWNTSNTLPWDTTFVDQFSGNKCFTDSRYGNYQSNTYTSISLKEEVNLIGTNNPYLAFNAKWHLEEDADRVYLEISTNNGNSWNSINSNGLDNNSYYTGNQYWTQSFIDLSDYIDEEILVRFRLSSDEYVQSDGFYFDDFTIVDYSSLPLSLIQLEADVLSVYPNPNKGQFRLHAKVAQDCAAKINIWNHLGESIFEENCQTTQRLLMKDVNLGNLDAGVYIVSIRLKDKIISEKIIIQ